MIRKIVVLISFLCGLGFLFITDSAFAESDLTGIWKGTFTVVEKDKKDITNMELMLSQKRNDITGFLTFKGSDPNEEGSDFKIEGLVIQGNVKFKAEKQGVPGGSLKINFSGTASSKSINGTMEIFIIEESKSKGKFEASR